MKAGEDGSVNYEEHELTSRDSYVLSLLPLQFMMLIRSLHYRFTAVTTK